MSQEVNDTIDDYLKSLRDRIRALEAALKEIAEHPHSDVRTWDECDQTLPVVLGHIQGHLCCADIARKALEK